VLGPRRRILLLAVAIAACAALATWMVNPGSDDDGQNAGATATAATPGPAQAPVRTPGDGTLRWLGGAAGCLKGSGGQPWIPCQGTVRGQFDISSMAISPDGGFAYGVSLNSGYRPNPAGKRIAAIRGGTIVAFSRNPDTGALTQLKGADGCIRDLRAPVNKVTAPCSRKGRALAGAKTITLSPDGRFAYVAALNNAAISAFKRNPRTGALHQLPGADACIGGKVGARSDCPRPARALQGVRWVTVSPDGRNVYASSPAGDAVAVFARDGRTGGLHQLPGTDACVEDTLARVRSGCARGPGVNYPRSITVSPDGRNAYVASDSADSAYPNDPADGDAVSAFARDPATGALRQLPGKAACVKDERARSTTACPTLAKGLLQPFSVAVSPDGRFVYVGSDYGKLGAIATFRRGPGGELVQLPGASGCIVRIRGCKRAKGIKGVDSVTITPDGTRLYATGFFGQTVAVFKRNRGTGVLSQVRGRGACVRDVAAKEPCSRAVRGLLGPRNVVLSPDGTSAYVPATVSGTIAVFRVGRAPRR